MQVLARPRLSIPCAPLTRARHWRASNPPLPVPVPVPPLARRAVQLLHRRRRLHRYPLLRTRHYCQRVSACACANFCQCQWILPVLRRLRLAPRPLERPPLPLPLRGRARGAAPAWAWAWGAAREGRRVSGWPLTTRTRGPQVPMPLLRLLRALLQAFLRSSVLAMLLLLLLLAEVPQP